MKICVSEKQLHKLILGYSQKDLDEQETPPSGPSSGAGSTGTKQGYPEVGKWESGVTRGPANQIKITKWSEIVGSVLKRGKANQLK